MHEVDRFALADGSYQHHLLRDEGRLDAYAKAVANSVRPGDVVADLGSGSGVLAHLAVRAGAARVYAVEAHQHAFAHLRRLVALNGLEARVRPVPADAERWVPEEPVQVVLCELMETGLLHEPAAAAVAHVHRAWPWRPRAIVPQGVRLLAEAVEVSDEFHGYRAPLPSFRDAGAGRALTQAACYLELDFEAAPPPPGVDAAFDFRAAEDGLVHALQLRTETRLGGLVFGSGPAYCTPVVLPLPQPFRVRAGDALRGRLRYTFAFDAEPLRFELATA